MNLNRCLKLIIFGIAIFGSLNCYAVKWEKCWKKSLKIANGKTGVKTWAEAGNKILAMTTSAPSTSTTSAVSSTGECALWARQDFREEYIAENFESIRSQSSQGKGEYVTALAMLSFCETQESQSRFRKTLQAQFENVYFPEGSPPVDAFRLSRQIDVLIDQEKVLNKSCVANL